MATLKLFLLGTFQATLDEQPLDGFRSDKSRALLAYLALNNNLPIQRTYLAELLWEGYQKESALASLRVTLNNLNQQLAALQILQLHRQTVQLLTTAPLFWCDALALDQAADSGDNSALWQTSVDKRDFTLGVFLPGFEYVDSPPFQRWLQEKRTHYQHQYARWRARRNQPAHRPTSVVPHNLPRELTPLIGRTAEVNALGSLLQDSTNTIITLLGEGGIGKTRLALAVAHTILNSRLTIEDSAAGVSENRKFPDGIWFVPLAAILPSQNLADHLTTAIGEALQVRFSGAEPLTDQLCRYLQHKQALLVLDNFEQLVEGAEWLITLLRRTTALQILVTSRHRLELEAEHIFRLDGLLAPEADISPTLKESDALKYSSVQLFVERARRTLTNFQLNSENVLAVVWICRFVEGLPLGIVLAATLLEQHSCAQIAAMLDENYTILAASLRDLPPRQRSIHAVIESSWQLLTQAERTLLAQCTVFRDIFTTDAAIQVTGASADSLARLEAKSLLRLVYPGHYEFHELVRQYAATQLYLDSSLMQQVHERHCQYYLGLIQEQEKQLHPGAHGQALIHEALANIRAAWAWATTQGDVEALAQSLPGLVRFYGLAGLQREAATGLSATISCLRQLITKAVKPSRGLRRLMTELLLEQAYFQLNIARADEAEALVEEALHFLPALADPRLEVTAYIRQGDVAWAKGDYARHRSAYEHSLRLAEASGWQLMIAHSLTNLGMNYDAHNEYAEAIIAYQAAQAITQQIDHRHQANIIYNNLGVSHELLGDFSSALHYYQQTLQASRELGDQEGSGIAHLNLGIVSTTLGDWENAQGHLTHALEIFQQGGHQRLEAKTLAQQALLFFQLENDERAQHYAQQAYELAQRGGFQAIAAEALTVMAHTRLHQQQDAEAEAFYRSALERWQHKGQLHRIIIAQSGLALSLYRQQKIAAAQQVIEEILNTLAINKMGPKHSFVFLACYYILTALHDARATSILQQSYQVLQKQAATITDPTLQNTFLTNIATNRQLMEMASKHQA
jgi:predicted ATPase